MCYKRLIALLGLIVTVFATGPRITTTGAQEDSIKILAWIGGGVAPGEHSINQPGQIVYLTGDEQVEVLFDLPQGTTRVVPCSEQATSPDGRYFAFFVGDETGTIYHVDGANSPVAIDTSVSALACLGMGTFQYSPDGSRFGYIDYTTNIATTPYAAGWLYVFDSETGESVFTTDSAAAVSDENVITFDISDDALAFVSLYSEATEAAIFYRADTYPVEVSTIFAEENCLFRSIEIAIVDDNTLALIVGQRCTGGIEWVLYTVNISQRSANRTLVTGDVIGGYYASARSNVMLVSPDTATLYFTFPDGLAQNSTNVQSVDLTDIQAGSPLLSNAIMPLYAPTNIYPRTTNALPVISSDGGWAAIITNTANGDAAVNVIELNATDLPPITIPAPSRGETVSAMAFTPDSTLLLFVMGGNNAENNSLFVLDLSSATENRLMRGRFGQRIVVSPDGQSAALPNWRVVNAPNQPNYLTLIAVNLETGEPSVVFTGAEIVNDTVTNQRFVYPLSWRG